MHRIRRVEIDDVRVQVFGGAAVVTERTHGVGQFARAEYDAVIGLRIRSSGATASGVLSLLTRVVATAATLEEQRPLQAHRPVGSGWDPTRRRAVYCVLVCQPGHAKG